MTVTDSESAAHLVEAYKLNRKHGILSRQEILLAVEISKKRHSDKLLQFIEINFQEPSKNELIESYLNNTALIRRAEVISLCLVLNQTFIDTVILSIGEKDGYLTIDELDLSEPNVNSSNDSNSNNSDINSNCNVKNYDNGNTIILKAVQAGISPDEYAFIEVLCKGYQPLLDVLAARGLDPTGLQINMILIPLMLSLLFHLLSLQWKLHLFRGIAYSTKFQLNKPTESTQNDYLLLSLL